MDMERVIDAIIHQPQQQSLQTKGKLQQVEKEIEHHSVYSTIRKRETFIYFAEIVILPVKNMKELLKKLGQKKMTTALHLQSIQKILVLGEKSLKLYNIVDEEVVDAIDYEEIVIADQRDDVEQVGLPNGIRPKEYEKITIYGKKQRELFFYVPKSKQHHIRDQIERVVAMRYQNPLLFSIQTSKLKTNTILRYHKVQIKHLLKDGQYRTFVPMHCNSTRDMIATQVIFAKVFFGCATTEITYHTMTMSSMESVTNSKYCISTLYRPDHNEIEEAEPLPGVNQQKRNLKPIKKAPLEIMFRSPIKNVDHVAQDKEANVEIYFYHGQVHRSEIVLNHVHFLKSNEREVHLDINQLQYYSINYDQIQLNTADKIYSFMLHDSAGFIRTLEEIRREMGLDPLFRDRYTLPTQSIVADEHDYLGTRSMEGYMHCHITNEIFPTTIGEYLSLVYQSNFIQCSLEIEVKNHYQNNLLSKGINTRYILVVTNNILLIFEIQCQHVGKPNAPRFFQVVHIQTIDHCMEYTFHLNHQKSIALLGLHHKVFGVSCIVEMNINSWNVLETILHSVEHVESPSGVNPKTVSDYPLMENHIIHLIERLQRSSKQKKIIHQAVIQFEIAKQYIQVMNVSDSFRQLMTTASCYYRSLALKLFLTKEFVILANNKESMLNAYTSMVRFIQYRVLLLPEHSEELIKLAMNADPTRPLSYIPDQVKQKKGLKTFGTWFHDTTSHELLERKITSSLTHRRVTKLIPTLLYTNPQRLHLLYITHKMLTNRLLDQIKMLLEARHWLVVKEGLFHEKNPAKHGELRLIQLLLNLQKYLHFGDELLKIYDPDRRAEVIINLNANTQVNMAPFQISILPHTQLLIQHRKEYEALEKLESLVNQLVSMISSLQDSTFPLAIEDCRAILKLADSYATYSPMHNLLQEIYTQTIYLFTKHRIPKLRKNVTFKRQFGRMTMASNDRGRSLPLRLADHHHKVLLDWGDKDTIGSMILMRDLMFECHQSSSFVHSNLRSCVNHFNAAFQRAAQRERELWLTFCQITSSKVASSSSIPPSFLSKRKAQSTKYKISATTRKSIRRLTQNPVVLHEQTQWLDRILESLDDLDIHVFDQTLSQIDTPPYFLEYDRALIDRCEGPTEDIPEILDATIIRQWKPMMQELVDLMDVHSSLYHKRFITIFHSLIAYQFPGVSFESFYKRVVPSLVDQFENQVDFSYFFNVTKEWPRLFYQFLFAKRKCEKVFIPKLAALPNLREDGVFRREDDLTYLKMVVHEVELKSLFTLQRADYSLERQSFSLAATALQLSPRHKDVDIAMMDAFNAVELEIAKIVDYYIEFLPPSKIHHPETIKSLFRSKPQIHDYVKQFSQSLLPLFNHGMVRSVIRDCHVWDFLKAVARKPPHLQVIGAFHFSNAIHTISGMHQDKSVLDSVRNSLGKQTSMNDLRFSSFIAFSLNANMLVSFFQVLCSQNEVINQFYEPFAMMHHLLLRERLNSLLDKLSSLPFYLALVK